MSETPQLGQLVWRDLTVEDASGVADFYREVVGWQMKAHPMEGYDDYEAQDASGQTVAGICHARGPNAAAPPQWLLYVKVASVEESAARCLEAGGKVLDGPRTMGGQMFCSIEDPAGAVIGLIE